MASRLSKGPKQEKKFAPSFEELYQKVLDYYIEAKELVESQIEFLNSISNEKNNEQLNKLQSFLDSYYEKEKFLVGLYNKNDRNERIISESREIISNSLSRLDKLARDMDSEEVIFRV